jgi:hypothetical protein
MGALRGVVIGLCLCFFALVLFFTVIGGLGVFGASAGRAFAEEIVEEAEARSGKPGADGRPRLADQVSERRRQADYRRWARERSGPSAPRGTRPLPDAAPGGGW